MRFSGAFTLLILFLISSFYQGEGVTDRSVWFIKTHYPERHGYKKYAIDRAILLIRNPFDAIQSYFHMGMTNTHNRTLTPEVTFHIRFLSLSLSSDPSAGIQFSFTDMGTIPFE
jgi:hypothetical protein